ncbi:MAG: Phenazine biosynthesis-like protein [Methanoregulaceae archaeon PtaB.Bin152]|nr:MAG: Phenazine biosynthesis-like protein [Methanoregulaceae archaeon PtaB.Bin152]
MVSPDAGVDLCSHATPAPAFVILSTGRKDEDSLIRFWKRAKTLTATSGSLGIALDFFSPVPVTPCDPPSGIEAALGIEVTSSGRTQFDLLCEVPSAADVSNLEPDIPAVAALPTMGIIVTAAGDVPAYDFVSWFFTPSVGIPEDPGFLISLSYIQVT